MTDIIIIGGGLTGLAAAYELERLGADYTLIEVRPRLGGSIITERGAGFVVDGGAFVLEQYDDWPFLAPLALSDALVPLGKYRDGRLVIFRDGTQMLTDALAARLTRPILKRMAVSSIGWLSEQRLGICLENGLLIDARAAIVTAPARYAAHMLYDLNPEIGLRLVDHRYDPVVRISLGYRAADVAHLPSNADDLKAQTGVGEGFKFLQTYSSAAMPSRVPSDHVLVRAGVRLDEAMLAAHVHEGRLSEAAQAEAIARVRAAIGNAEPVVSWAHFWPEADSLTRYLPEHAENMAAIEALLPPNVALVGSDYRARRLDQAVMQGWAAARRVGNAL